MCLVLAAYGCPASGADVGDATTEVLYRQAVIDARAG